MEPANLDRNEMAPSPQRFPYRPRRPMTWGEVAEWIASYNAWVKLWNRHEMDPALPLSPDWDDAEVPHDPHVPSDCLTFTERSTRRWVAIRLRDWHEFHEGWSFCRNEIRLDHIVWATKDARETVPPNRF